MQKTLILYLHKRLKRTTSPPIRCLIRRDLRGTGLCTTLYPHGYDYTVSTYRTRGRVSSVPISTVQRIDIESSVYRYRPSGVPMSTVRSTDIDSPVYRYQHIAPQTHNVYCHLRTMAKDTSQDCCDITYRPQICPPPHSVSYILMSPYHRKQNVTRSYN